MISIDFQGGAHGNFLEVVCNKIAGVDCAGLPFNQFGASHQKTYTLPKQFVANHFSFLPADITTQKVISIQMTEDDLLPLSQISLLRAGDFGIDNDHLEINTYNKLNTAQYRWVLDILLDSFFTGQIAASYNAVKDPSWPEIQTLTEFHQLPQHIQQECLEIHNLQLIECSAESPNCPRHILREFFEIGFANPANSGFITQQQKMQYDNLDVYIFPFASFYNTDLFIEQVKSIAAWADIVYNDYESLVDLHTEFLKRQPYASSKQRCDTLIEQMIHDKNFLPTLTLMEEAYVNAKLVKVGHERRY